MRAINEAVPEDARAQKRSFLDLLPIRTFFLGSGESAGPSRGSTQKRQATGTIASIAPAKLVLNKQFGRNKTQWNFTVTPKVSMPSGISKGARVIVYYHEEKDQRIADRVKFLAAPSAPMKPAA